MLSKAAKRVLGIGVIVAGVLLIVIGVTKPNPFADTRSVWAEFDSVQGLGAIGRDVRLAGVNVGVIGEVKREGDDALVELVLDEDVSVHTDARVAMRPHTLFEGSSFVDLDPGSPSAPLLGDAPIPLEQTSNYVTLDEALRVLRPEIRESLKDLAGVGARTLRGDAIDGIQRTLKGAPDLTRSLRAPARALQGPEGDELSGAIAGMSQTVDAVAEQEDQLIPLAQRLNRTASALTIDSGAPLDATLAELPGALTELRDGAPPLTALVDRLDTFSARVNPALPELAAAFSESTPVIEQSIPVLRDAGPLVADLRVVAQRLTDAAPTLARLIRTLDPVVDTFGGSVLPVLHEESRQGQPTYKQLSAFFSAADAVFRPYQTLEQNPNGTGHLWNLGTFIDPEAAGGLGDVLGGGGLPGLPLQGSPGLPGLASCDDVKEVSASAARELEASGGCS